MWSRNASQFLLFCLSFSPVVRQVLIYRQAHHASKLHIDPKSFVWLAEWIDKTEQHACVCNMTYLPSAEPNIVLTKCIACVSNKSARIGDHIVFIRLNTLHVYYNCLSQGCHVVGLVWLPDFSWIPGFISLGAKGVAWAEGEAIKFWSGSKIYFSLALTLWDKSFSFGRINAIHLRIQEMEVRTNTAIFRNIMNPHSSVRQL